MRSVSTLRDTEYGDHSWYAFDSSYKHYRRGICLTTAPACGAWNIAHRAWGVILARGWLQHGVLASVTCLAVGTRQQLYISERSRAVGRK